MSDRYSIDYTYQNRPKSKIDKSWILRVRLLIIRSPRVAKKLVNISVDCNPTKEKKKKQKNTWKVTVG
jgi:hypothetical protein